MLLFPLQVGALLIAPMPQLMQRVQIFHRQPYPSVPVSRCPKIA